MKMKMKMEMKTHQGSGNGMDILLVERDDGVLARPAAELLRDLEQLGRVQLEHGGQLGFLV